MHQRYRAGSSSLSRSRRRLFVSVHLSQDQGEASGCIRGDGVPVGNRAPGPFEGAGSVVSRGLDIGVWWCSGSRPPDLGWCLPPRPGRLDSEEAASPRHVARSHSPLVADGATPSWRPPGSARRHLRADSVSWRWRPVLPWPGRTRGGGTCIKAQTAGQSPAPRRWGSGGFSTGGCRCSRARLG